MRLYYEFRIKLHFKLHSKCSFCAVQTYEELMALAEKGTNLNIDMTTQSVAPKTEDSKDEEDMYSTFRELDPRPAFLWGQAVTKDPCKYTCTVPSGT